MPARNHSVQPAATYADIEALPPNVVGEILFGELVTHPRPAPRHAVASSALHGVLNEAFQRGRQGPGGWIFMVEPELHLGPHVAVPDIAGWRRERLPELPDTAWIETPPDWVCEMLSPSTENYDRGSKRQIYATYGVMHLWLIDPRPRLLEAFALSSGSWLLLATLRDNEDVRVQPFDAISFSLAELWPFDTAGNATPLAT
jgi:Uma2 family endonuclease